MDRNDGRSEDEDEDEEEGKARDSKRGLKIGLSAPSARNPIKYRRYPRGEV